MPSHVHTPALSTAAPRNQGVSPGDTMLNEHVPLYQHKKATKVLALALALALAPGLVLAPA